jgi:hypothetical protein
MKIKTFFFSLFALVLFISLVSAIVVEENRVREATIDENNNLLETTNPVNGASVYGVICSSSDCSSISGELFNGSILAVVDDEITLQYPTILQSVDGYGIYFFKDGWIPYEVEADWSGNGNVGPFNNFLSRKEMCSAPIENLVINKNGNEIDVSFSISSPIDNSGPLKYIPQIIEDQYKVDVNLEMILKKNNSEVENHSQVLTIDYSGNKSLMKNFNLSNGLNELTIKTYNKDPLCLSSDDQIEKRDILIQEPQVFQCNDGIDNDNDSLIDFPNDPGCTNPNDNSEKDPVTPMNDFYAKDIKITSNINESDDFVVEFIPRATDEVQFVNTTLKVDNDTQFFGELEYTPFNKAIQINLGNQSVQNHTLMILIDPIGQIPEFNETDNNYSLDFFVI